MAGMSEQSRRRVDHRDYESPPDGEKDILEWVRRCADVCSRARMHDEARIWREIAERGAEFHAADLPPGTRMMEAQACFANSALTVMGATEWQDEGLWYAEGFALSVHGFWAHHAWISDSAGHAYDRTWMSHGLRYLGVRFPVDETSARLGGSMMIQYPVGFAWGPDFISHPELLEGK